jgi:DNA-binding response OmpR family regulator
MSGLKFLVIDDATFIRDMLKKSLRDYFHGSEILDASSAKKAQTLLKTNRVDLILCDWEMPEMTGEEFLRWIRSNERYADLPFIMVTSRGERDYIVKAAQAGVSDYLGKPFKPEALVAKVTKALKKAGIAVNVPEKAAPGGVTSSGLDVLTGGAASIKTNKPKQALSDSASLLTGGAPVPQAKSKAPLKKAKPAACGQAMLNFASFTSQCVIKDISLQLMNCAIKREDTLPVILEPVVISIVQNDGEDVARLNGYVHSIQAAENRIDANILKLVIRFVDDDPEKLEHLSRYIATL